MLNLDRHSFEFPCPKCSFYNSATVRQVRLRDILICRGCKTNLQLDDYMNSFRKSRERIQTAARDLQRALNKLR
jgi:hypothetical protein